jgi:hypothetical protein
MGLRQEKFRIQLPTPNSAISAVETLKVRLEVWSWKSGVESVYLF